MTESPLVPVRAVLRKTQPSCGEWFFVGAELFVRPRQSEVRSFPDPIGLCVQGRRCETLSPYEYPDPWSRAPAVGEREWVRVSSIGLVFRDEAGLYSHLWPGLFEREPPKKGGIDATHRP